jgi:hypothetical protein
MMVANRHDPPEPPGDGGGPWLPGDGAPPARWLTFRSARGPEEVSERVRQALAVSGREGRDSVTGVRTRDGYVLRMTFGRKRVTAEVRLHGWEGGTQVHVTVPGDVRLSAAQMRRCAACVASIVGEEVAQDL